MPNKIITELWQIKDAIAREHNYDIRAFVAYLQSKKRHKGRQVVDLGSLKRAAETRRAEKSKKD